MVTFEVLSTSTILVFGNNLPMLITEQLDTSPFDGAYLVCGV